MGWCRAGNASQGTPASTNRGTVSPVWADCGDPSDPNLHSPLLGSIQCFHGHDFGDLKWSGWRLVWKSGVHQWPRSGQRRCTPIRFGHVAESWRDRPGSHRSCAGAEPAPDLFNVVDWRCKWLEVRRVHSCGADTVALPESGLLPSRGQGCPSGCPFHLI